MTTSHPLHRALAWSAINQVSNRIISLVSTMIIFRILTPFDVGIYAAALVLVALINMVNDFGLTAAIEQYNGNLNRAVRTGVTLVLIFSVILFAFQYFAAPIVASIFSEPEITTLIRVLAITTLIDGLSSMPLALLIREMKQKRIAVIETIATISQLIVGVFLALRGYGAMALVIAMIVSNAISAALVIAPYLKRIVPSFHADSAKELLRFGRHMAGANIVSHLALNVDTIMIGRNMNAVALGRYQAAFNAGSLPSTTISTLLGRVSFASLAKVRHDPERFRRMAYAFLTVTIAAALLSGSLLSALAEPYIVTVYGEQWRSASTLLMILGFLGAYRVIQFIFLDIFSASGHPRFELLVASVWITLLIPSMYFASHISTMAVAWTHIVISFVFLLPLILFIATKIKLELRQILMTFAIFAPASAVAYVIALIIGNLITNYLIALFAGGIVGTAVFFGLTFKKLKQAIQILNAANISEDEMRGSEYINRINIYDDTTESTR